MDKSKIVKLLQLIDELVNADVSTWREKQQLVLNESDENDKINLAEFCGWFDGA